MWSIMIALSADLYFIAVIHMENYDEDKHFIRIVAHQSAFVNFYALFQ